MGVDVEQLLVSGVGWRELLGRLRHEHDRIAERLLTRLPELASYAGISTDELRPGALSGVRALLDSLHLEADPDRPSNRNGRNGRTDPTTTARQLGELRARQGVSAGDLVRGWHVTCEEIVRRAREILPAGADTDRLLLHLYGQILVRLGGNLDAAAEGHRDAEVDRARREQHAHANLVRALFSDRLTPAGLHRRAEAFRLDRTAEYHAVRARPRHGTGAGAVERYLQGGDHLPNGTRDGVLALVDDDVCGFLRRLPTDPAPIAVGVSDPVPLSDLPAAFRSATRLLDTAVVLGRTGLVNLTELGLDTAVVANEDVGEAMLARYVYPLEHLGPAGELILDTVARYVANDGRLDTTARELHVHVNTVRYRLGRFEQVTSRSLRSNETLVQVWWAMRCRAMAAVRRRPPAV